MAVESEISQIVIDAYPKGNSPIDWASWIQAIGSIVSVCITLVFGTYAWIFQKKAHRLQEISQKQFELLNRPYLHISPNTKTGFFVEKEGDEFSQKIRSEFILKNVGKAPLACIVDQIELNEQTIVHPNNPIIIFPEQEITVWTTVIDLPEKVKTTNLMYTASISIKYWPLSDPTQIYKRYQKQQISTIDGKNAIMMDEAD